MDGSLALISSSKSQISMDDILLDLLNNIMSMSLILIPQSLDKIIGRYAT